MFTRLTVLFFFSGASALVYQVLWLRQLSLIFGVTVYAASTVLATFMAGLAIGSAAAGRLSDRVRRPLLWFGAAEAVIGLTALLLPLALDLVTAGYVGSRRSWSRARWRLPCDSPVQRRFFSSPPS